LGKAKRAAGENAFCLRCDKEFILTKSIDFLESKNLKPYNFLKDERKIPLVFAWMPAIAIYFDDPDGHCLEFISVLEGEGARDLGVITYEEWINYLKEKRPSAVL
jgi:hypothetical protein